MILSKKIILPLLMILIKQLMNAFSRLGINDRDLQKLRIVSQKIYWLIALIQSGRWFGQSENYDLLA